MNGEMENTNNEQFNVLSEFHSILHNTSTEIEIICPELFADLDNEMPRQLGLNTEKRPHVLYIHTVTLSHLFQQIIIGIFYPVQK